MAPSKLKPRTSKLGLWAALAALVHLEIALVLGVILYAVAPRDAELKADLEARGLSEVERIDIGMVDEEAARRIIADLEREAEKAKEAETKKEIDSTKAPGQVVDIPKPRDEQRPKDARFASEHDSSVERETKRYGRYDERAQQGDLGGKADQSRPATPPAPARPEIPPVASRVPAARARHESPRALGEVAPRRARVSAPTEVSPDGVLPNPGPDTAAQPGTDGAPGLPSLLPSEQQLARAIGGGTQDALKGVDDGDETALNSKKWKFASFFNRLKRQVADHWHPDEAYRRRDPTGAVYGQKDRLTVLRVQLKPDGSLANVALETPSGVEFLDDEAIEAFKQAQPFPNPPRQLIEEGGVINFRFGFLFELSTAPRMKVFRYNSM